MRRRARPEEPSHSGRDRWLVSYADFITLLFAFFVVLFASSHHDNEEFRRMAGAIHKGFTIMGASGEQSVDRTPPSPPASPAIAARATAQQTSAALVSAPSQQRPGALAHPTDVVDVVQVEKELQSVLGESIAKQEITMQLTPEGFVISLRELGFFNSGEARLLPGAEEKIKQTGKVLMAHGLMISRFTRPRFSRTGSYRRRAPCPCCCCW